jgi:hypothetical protein
MKIYNKMNYFLEPGDEIIVVGYDTILEKGFFVRQRFEFPMMSESGGWDLTFKDNSWMGTAWHLIEEELPYWVGKTYNQYRKHLGHDFPINHEIIRLK